MVIFIANLNFKLQETQLQKLFEQYGAVSSVRIINDRQTGRSKGYGFVEMPDETEANSAISALNEYMLEGKPIAVKEARPKSEETPRKSNYRGGGEGRGGNRNYNSNRNHNHDRDKY